MLYIITLREDCTSREYDILKKISVEKLITFNLDSTKNYLAICVSRSNLRIGKYSI